MNTGVAKKQLKSEMTEHGENNMKISQEGIELIKKFEGCELEAYKCAAGVWTIGYGHTEGVNPNDEMDKEAAEELLALDLVVYEKSVNWIITAPLNQQQFDALVSFTFNLGETNLCNSTLRKVLNEEKYDEVPNQIRRWNKAGGKVNEGLIRRREAEALLFEGNNWEHV